MKTCAKTMQFSNFQDTGKKNFERTRMPNCTMGQKFTFFFSKIQNLLKSTIWERPLALVMKDFLF